MDRTYKTGNKKVIWIMGIVSVIIFGYLAYMNLCGSEECYYSINSSIQGISIQMETIYNDYILGQYYNIYSYSMMASTVLSILFLIFRFLRVIKVRDKETEELVLSYPMSRKQIMQKEISNAGYGIWVCIWAVLILFGLFIVEMLKGFELKKKVGSHILVNNDSMQVLISALLIFALLLFAIAWHYLCEIVARDRIAGFFLGMLGIGAYNCWLWGDMDYLIYFEYGKEELLVGGAVWIFVCLLTILLFVIDAKLYEKIDFSKGGMFYFAPAKYFFISSGCLILLYISNIFGDDVLMGNRLLLIGLDLILLVALNYLALSDTERKSGKKILVENLKNLLALGVMLLVLSGGYVVMFGLPSAEPMTADEDWGYNMQYSVMLNDAQNYESFVKNTKAMEQNILLPDEQQGWVFQSGGANYMPVEVGESEQLLDYNLYLKNDQGERFSIYFTRGYSANYCSYEDIDINNVRIISDNKNEIVFIKPYSDTEATISVYRFYDSKEYYDWYSFYGTVTEEELIAIVEKFMG